MPNILLYFQTCGNLTSFVSFRIIILFFFSFWTQECMGVESQGVAIDPVMLSKNIHPQLLCCLHSGWISYNGGKCYQGRKIFSEIKYPTDHFCIHSEKVERNGKSIFFLKCHCVKINHNQNNICSSNIRSRYSSKLLLYLLRILLGQTDAHSFELKLRLLMIFPHQFDRKIF